MGSAKTIELNQKQVLGVTKYLYQFEQKKDAPVAPQEGDYAKFFRETKEMGKYKGWNDTQLTEALKNRKKTEVQLDIVSRHHFDSNFYLYSTSLNNVRRMLKLTERPSTKRIRRQLLTVFTRSPRQSVYTKKKFPKIRK